MIKSLPLNREGFFYLSAMIKPPYLKPGDTVGITAPARKVKPEDMEGVEKLFSSWGLKTVFSKNLYSNSHNYLSGTDQERTFDLQNFLDDPSIHAIFCARGGYGTTRIVDNLSFQNLAKNPKWIIGFSDITALHLKLIRNDIESIHGTVPLLFSQSDSKNSVESLRKVLFGHGFTLNAKVDFKNVNGSVSGKLVGGNLSLVLDSLGTADEIETNDKILVIEEIDEYKYKLDRMLMQLKRAGKFDKLIGLVVGHLTSIKDGQLPFGESVEEIILQHTGDYRFPVGFNFPTGHENPNLAWINGGDSFLKITSSESILTSLREVI